MKRRKILIVSVVTLSVIILCSLFVLCRMVDVFETESPSGEYRTVNVMIDKGALGYGGACYVKKAGVFSKWHKVEDAPCSVEWVSETELEIFHDEVQYDHPNYVEGSMYRTKHHIREFFGEEN